MPIINQYMQNVLIDLTGQRFGKLKVLGISERATREGLNGKPTKTKFRCVCDCGNETITEGRYLRGGRTRSCGCLRADSMRRTFRTHGEGGKFYTPEYQAWCSMRQRCLNPTDKKYHCYGARGIKICERWDKYENFLADMGRKPDAQYSLDRINVNGDYEPLNCRWLGPKGQYWNRQGSFGQVFIEVARRELSEEEFNIFWSKSMSLQEERTKCDQRVGMLCEQFGEDL